MKNENLHAVLEKILLWVEKLEIPLNKYLMDGENYEYIKNELGKKLLLEPSAELLELYSWKNGVKITKDIYLDEIQFIPGYHFLSFQDAISTYNNMKKNHDWNINWFPFMSNGGGDFYAINLLNNENKINVVIGYLRGESEQIVEYECISSMFNTFLKDYEDGVIYKDKNGYLEIDDDDHLKNSITYNPSINYESML